jgi:hypothetical protein
MHRKSNDIAPRDVHVGRSAGDSISEVVGTHAERRPDERAVRFERPDVRIIANDADAIGAG